MSTEENIPEETQDVSMDDFEKDFFQVEEPKEEVNEEEEETEDTQETEDEDTLATEDDDDSGETDDDQEEESDNEEDDSEEEPDTKPKPKNRAQERIEELNAKYREQEREKLAALAEIAELKRKLEQDNKEPEPNTSKEKVEDTGPRPDDKDENGEDKYPLGEFDPSYLKDMVAHTLKVEREAMESERAAAEAEKARKAEQDALQSSWNEKLEPARERYPDFEEKGQQLVDNFQDLDASYGEYLTSILMSMDHGPDVLYYLASNPDEAKTIVNKGAAQATIALGRLEAKFADAVEEKQKARPKVSKAKDPPPANKGRSAVSGKLDPSSEDVDLDALTKELFKK